MDVDANIDDGIEEGKMDVDTKNRHDVSLSFVTPINDIGKAAKESQPKIDKAKSMLAESKLRDIQPIRKLEGRNATLYPHISKIPGPVFRNYPGASLAGLFSLSYNVDNEIEVVSIPESLLDEIELSDEKFRFGFTEGLRLLDGSEWKGTSVKKKKSRNK